MAVGPPGCGDLSWLTMEGSISEANQKANVLAASD